MEKKSAAKHDQKSYQEKFKKELKRNHEINEIVSREELVMCISDDFLFGDKIEFDKEKLEKIRQEALKGKKKKSDNLAGHDGVVERPGSPGDPKANSPSYKNRS